MGLFRDQKETLKEEAVVETPNDCFELACAVERFAFDAADKMNGKL